jgi:hypothetical protein
MKRLAATAIFCWLAFTLVSASAAGASTAPRQIDLLRLQHAVAPLPAGSFAQRDAQTYPVTGTMKGFDGTPLADFWVTCGWYDPDGYSWFVPDALYHDAGDTSTAADGSFSLAGVPSHPGHDSLMAGSYSGDGLNYMILYHLDFSTTGSYVLRPGHVNISVAHAPAGKRVHVSLGDANYSAADSSVGLTEGYGVADAWAPDFNSARVYFDNAIGTVTAECEWVNPGHAPVAVNPGAVAGTSVDFDWRSAVRGRLVGPRCGHSGRPGSTVKYSISDLPAGQQISFFGQSWSPYTWGVQTYPQVVTSSDPQNTYTVALRIPKRATVGDVYWIQAQRSDDVQSLLWLYDYYEVCSFAATRSVIAYGDSVSLHGHIDGKEATLFMRHRRAGQPATAKARGWSKVTDLSVSAGGRFVSSGLQPSRTTWYVVRYHGLNGGFTAFTPVVRVSVR